MESHSHGDDMGAGGRVRFCKGRGLREKSRAEGQNLGADDSQSRGHNHDLFNWVSHQHLQAWRVHQQMQLREGSIP